MNLYTCITYACINPVCCRDLDPDPTTLTFEYKLDIPKMYTCILKMKFARSRARATGQTDRQTDSSAWRRQEFSLSEDYSPGSLEDESSTVGFRVETQVGVLGTKFRRS